MTKEVFHAPTFSNPPMNTQTATVNNTINLNCLQVLTPQQWSDLETFVELVANINLIVPF